MLAPPELAFDYLRAEQTKQLENRLKAGELWASPWNLVFTDEVGRHYRTSTSYNHFKRIAAKIGRPSARPHDLRHIAATVAIASGADKKLYRLCWGMQQPRSLWTCTRTHRKMIECTAARVQVYYSNLKSIDASCGHGCGHKSVNSNKYNTICQV